MTDRDTLLITAALPYTNGPIHTGHIAGCYLPADIYCRYQRLKGRKLIFICGSDEHGVAIMLRARREGLPPQEVVDRYHELIKSSFEGLGMSFDHYGRTSRPLHHETSREFFRTLARKGVFVLRTESLLYDPEAEMFLADRFVRGTCPHCGYEEAYGDQCESCGRSLSPSELIDPRSAITDAVPIYRETTHWYLPLDKMQPKLEAWIATHGDWKPNVLGQVRSWLKEGLTARAVTRDLPWGVRVPEDVAEAAGVDASSKVLYVWFDAPIGYISSTREWAEKQGEPELWREYWQNENTKLVHFLGKDNIVFHCLIFPAMLMAHGDYVLPDNVPANEFLNLKGQKLSTSKNLAVWIDEYLEVFKPDLLRYALATILPETRDADFSWEDFQSKVNFELADTLGNFVNRTLTFAARYFDNKVPPLANPGAMEADVLKELAEYPGRISDCYEHYKFRDGVALTMALARLGNKYFNDAEPWATRKIDLEKCGTTIHVCAQLCASLAVLIDPVMPHAATELREMLRLDGVRSSMPGRSAGTVAWDDAGEPLLAAGHELGEAAILFHKIDDELIEAQIAKLEAAAGGVSAEKAEPFAPLGPEIEYDDFAKLDLRMGVVTGAAPVPKADKLLCLQVDLGFETRQILAGVAEQMKPEQLVGKRVVAVANLKPRKLRGLMSQGMLLMAEDRDGTLRPITSEGEPGGVVR